MLDRLPYDVIVLIVDLVIPLPTSANLAERQKLCRWLAFLHRNWTRPAQQKLLQHLPVNLGRQNAQFRGRLQHVQRFLGLRGGQVRGLEMKRAVSEGDDAADVKAAKLVLERCTGLRTLFVRDFSNLPFSASEVPDLEVLSFRARLTKMGETGQIFPHTLPYSSFPSNLTRLHLSHCYIKTRPPTFLHLKILTLRRCVVSQHTSGLPFLSSFPTLSTLAWDETEPILSFNFLDHAPPTLRHLLVDLHDTRLCVCILETIRALAGQALESLTLRAVERPFLPSFETHGGSSESWRGLNVAIRKLVVSKADEFDLEEWSLTVG